MKSRRRLIFQRENETSGALAEFHAYIDGADAGNIPYRQKKTVSVDCASHTVAVLGSFSNGVIRSRDYVIPAGEEDCTFLVEQRKGLFASEIILEELYEYEQPEAEEE